MSKGAGHSGHGILRFLCHLGIVPVNGCLQHSGLTADLFCQTFNRPCLLGRCTVHGFLVQGLPIVLALFHGADISASTDALFAASDDSFSIQNLIDNTTLKGIQRSNGIAGSTASCIKGVAVDIIIRLPWPARVNTV